MREINFKMPAPSMFIVPPEGTPGYRGMLATFPETVKYMQETITPAMGKLLGKESFSCAGCHPTEAPNKKKVAPKQSRSKTKG
jgi:mono/diheme cytochrome c family protein